MIPAWLQRTLGDTYRTVRLRLCPNCRAPILVGLDADICAFTARADPTPIDEIGEAVALLTGRRTYDLTGTGSGKQLNAREEHNITAPRKYLVFPEHRCGKSLAAHIDPAASTAKRKTPEEPPF